MGCFRRCRHQEEGRGPPIEVSKVREIKNNVDFHTHRNHLTPAAHARRVTTRKCQSQDFCRFGMDFSLWGQEEGLFIRNFA